MVGNPAMMDSSDGLADTLCKICLLSKVNMEIEFNEIPYDKDILRIAENFKDWVLFGGEDYELVATMPEEIFEKLKQEIFIKRIGVVKPAHKEPFADIRFKHDKSLKIDSGSIEKSRIFKHFE